MANPRIDDLRKKLDREPASRLFAQLAEELRKEGDLAEAVRVARQGLSHHPNYPSARMTLAHWRTRRVSAWHLLTRCVHGDRRAKGRIGVSGRSGART